MTLSPTLHRKWSLQKADWASFTEKLDTTELTTHESADQMLEYFLSNLNSAAAATIPMSRQNNNKRRVPWWNKQCASTIKHKRQMWRHYRNHLTQENLINFKIARAQTRWTIYYSKRTSWRSFISTITSSTPCSLLWNKIRLLANKRTYNTIPAIRDSTGNIIKNVADIAETCADFYFRNMKNDSPSVFPEIPMVNDNPATDTVNREIMTGEVEKAISSLKKSAPGPNQIHSGMLKHMNHIHTETITRFFNHIQKNHDFPSRWGEAFIIPVLKTSKDRTMPTSYRPISLTNILCKTFEKIIAGRLYENLLSRNVINEAQCGFLPNRSTIDNLVHLAKEIKIGIYCKQHTVGIFFDVEKAFDHIDPVLIIQYTHYSKCSTVAILFTSLSNFWKTVPSKYTLGKHTRHLEIKRPAPPPGICT